MWTLNPFTLEWQKVRRNVFKLFKKTMLPYRAFYLRIYEVRVQYHGGICCLIKVLCRRVGYDIDSVFAVDINKG